MSEPTSFYCIDGDRFVPTSIASGPWDPKSLHGRLVAGLLAAEIERLHGDDTFTPARLTVDLFRLPDLSPATVTTTVVRAGARIRVIDAVFESAGKPMGRATCQLLKRTRNAPGAVWSPPEWQVPRPDAMPATEPHNFRTQWTTRPITGGFGVFGQKRIWMREDRELIDGRPLTPWVRAALASDFASPFANAGDAGLGYINSDASLYLHRLPRGVWIGLEVANHHATDGVAIGECFVYDEDGAIGSANVVALAQGRSPG